MSWKDRSTVVDEVSTSQAAPKKSSWKDRSEVVPEGASSLEAAARGLAQGGTLGFSDEIGAGLQTAGDYIAGLLGDDSQVELAKKLQEQGFTGDIGPTDYKDLYKQARDANRKDDEAAKAAHPELYAAGELSGGLATSLIPGLNVAKGATLAGTVGKTALAGGLAGLGSSNADLTEGDVGGAAWDTAKGAAIGGALGAAGYGVGKGIEKLNANSTKAAESLASRLEDVADDRAASALGFTKALRNKYGNEEAKAIGRSALNNDIIGLSTNSDEMLARAQALNELSGQTIGDTLKRLDDAGIKSFNPLDTAVRVDSEIGNAYRNEPLFKGLSNQYENTLDTILKRGDKNISFEEAQQLKDLLGQYGYKEGLAVEGKEIAQRAGGIVKDEMEKAVESGAKTLGDKTLSDSYKLAKAQYGNSSKMIDALENKVAGEAGNQGSIVGGLFGLKNAGAKIAGGAIGGPKGYVVGNAIAEGARTFGNQVTAITADRIADVVRSSPQLLGKYAPVLQNAAQRGSQALAAAHFVLQQQDPNYRDTIKNLEGQSHE